MRLTQRMEQRRRARLFGTCAVARALNVRDHVVIIDGVLYTVSATGRLTSSIDGRHWFDTATREPITLVNVDYAAIERRIIDHLIEGTIKYNKAASREMWWQLYGGDR